MKGRIKMNSKVFRALAIIIAAAAIAGTGCSGNGDNKTESSASSAASSVSASSAASGNSAASGGTSQSSVTSSPIPGFFQIAESSADESSDDYEEVILKLEDAVGTWTCSNSKYFKTIELKSNGDAKLTLTDNATIDTYFRIRGSKLYINIMQFDDPFTLEDGKLIYDDEGDVFTRTKTE